MLSKRSSLLVAFLGGLAVGVGYPYVDIAIKCRVPISEACVWGKAFFSLTLPVSVVLVGGITAGVLYAALAWLRHCQSRGGGRQGP